MGDDRFQTCLSFTLDHEGRNLEYDPHDPGGVTFAGIDQRDHPGVDVRHLTLAGASAIYRVEKWKKFRCAEFIPGWDLIVFDSAVNPGPGWPPRALQGVLGVIVDGFIGPKTIAAANNASLKAKDEFLDRRLAYYKTLPASLRSRYMAGWVNRTEALRKRAQADAYAYVRNQVANS
jgi:lysozyme family protein